MSAPIVITCQPHFGYWSEPCALCGGQTEEAAVLPVFVAPDGAEHFVCGECLEAGAPAAPGRVLAWAVRLERWAAALRELLVPRQFTMPSVAEWRAANEAHEAQVAVEDFLDGLNRPPTEPGEPGKPT